MQNITMQILPLLTFEEYLRIMKLIIVYTAERGKNVEKA